MAFNMQSRYKMILLHGRNEIRAALILINLPFIGQNNREHRFYRVWLDESACSISKTKGKLDEGDYSVFCL